jgi:bacterioferritin
MRSLRADHQAHHGRGASRLRERLRGMPHEQRRATGNRGAWHAGLQRLARTLSPRLDLPVRYGTFGDRNPAAASFRTGVQAMRGDARVIEYLNKALRHELTAVNQYWLHYRLLDNWGYKDLAKKWREESIEEMQHADRLTVRIIFLDGFPNMQVLDPLHIGQTVKEVLDSDLGIEISARELYQEAATYCHSVKDYVTRDLFEELMADEEGHIDFLETQLDLVAKLGLELYAQHHIGELDEED